MILYSLVSNKVIHLSNKSKAKFIAKEDGILSGIDVVNRVFMLVGGEYVTYTLSATDHMGNINIYETQPIPVYDVMDITLDYIWGSNDVF